MKLIGQTNFHPKGSSPRHIIMQLSEIKDKENFKSRKRKKKLYIRGHLYIYQQKSCGPGESEIIYSKC